MNGREMVPPSILPTALSKMVATSYVRLFKFNLKNLKNQFLNCASYIQVLNSHMWRVDNLVDS